MKHEVQVFIVASSDGDLFGLRTVKFMPSRDGVVSRRQVWQRKRASVVGDGVMRILEYCKNAAHPGMKLTLHLDEFRLVITDHDGRSARGLRAIPLGIHMGHRMHGVRDHVVILHPDFLAGLDRGDMRRIAATSLVKVNNLRLTGGIFVGSALRDKDDYVLQTILRASNANLRHRGRRIELGTVRFGRHVDGFVFLGCTFIGDLTGDSAIGDRIHGAGIGCVGSSEQHCVCVPKLKPSGMGDAKYESREKANSEAYEQSREGLQVRERRNCCLSRNGSRWRGKFHKTLLRSD